MVVNVIARITFFVVLKEQSKLFYNQDFPFQVEYNFLGKGLFRAEHILAQLEMVQITLEFARKVLIGLTKLP
jgi:hypothetical protein